MVLCEPLVQHRWNGKASEERTVSDRHEDVSSHCMGGMGPGELKGTSFTAASINTSTSI